MTADSEERLHIDWTACDGRGLCTELLPELLDRDPWGYPLSRDGQREARVPRELVAHARRAANGCPRLALRLLTDAQRVSVPLRDRVWVVRRRR